MLDSRIIVLDSQTACGGYGMVAIGAANAAAAGSSLAQTAELGAALAQSAKTWFAIDTLEYLRRGGRIGGAQAWLGSALKIKPILTVDSQITPVERVRTSKRAFERLTDYMRTRADDGCKAWFVQHIRAAEQADRLVERGREIFSTEPICITEIGPVIGTHVGPGLLGTCAVPQELLAGRVAQLSASA